MGFAALSQEEEVVYTPAELAIAWKCNKQTVLNLCHSGQLNAFSVGTNYRITTKSVDEFIQAHPVVGAGKRQPRQKAKKVAAKVGQPTATPLRTHTKP